MRGQLEGGVGRAPLQALKRGSIARRTLTRIAHGSQTPGTDSIQRTTTGGRYTGWRVGGAPLISSYSSAIQGQRISGGLKEGHERPDFGRGPGIIAHEGMAGDPFDPTVSLVLLPGGRPSPLPATPHLFPAVSTRVATISRRKESQKRSGRPHFLRKPLQLQVPHSEPGQGPCTICLRNTLRFRNQKKAEGCGPDEKDGARRKSESTRSPDRRTSSHPASTDSAASIRT